MQNTKIEQQENAETITVKFYSFSTVGSTSERVARVAHASRKMEIDELAVACVGDKVVYEDGSETLNIDGAGFAAVYLDKPLALVGGRLGNGDRIVKTLQTGVGGPSALGLTSRDCSTPTTCHRQRTRSAFPTP